MNKSGPSSSEKQRQAAAEIARDKVLASYNQAASNTNTYKKAPISTSVTNEDWQKYHSAWQNYYQKYYSEYYAKAAHQYLETKKLKAEREQKDTQNLLGQKPTTHQKDIENSLKDRIQTLATENLKKSRRRRHLLPIFAGATVALLILFLQYNRLFFAPIMAYISPSSSTDSSISSIDPTVTKAPGPEPKLLIPKLNIDVPVHFNISNDEATVMNAMEHGVAQFAIPGAQALPGQLGNLIITGHSAGDIYSNNQYKFIFSGLERLKAGDSIYINYNSTRYTYTINQLETVEPTNIAALTRTSSAPKLTLVTCTPLGTSRYRLLIHAEQISPASKPSEEKPNLTPAPIAETPKALPANEPSFFDHIWRFFTGH